MFRTLLFRGVRKCAMNGAKENRHLRYSSSGYRDPYQVLGVARGSSESDVKTAYKSLALKWHPDRNDSPQAEEKFKEISEAYTMITKGGPSANPFNGQQGDRGSGFRPQGQGFPHELFRQMFADQVSVIIV